MRKALFILALLMATILPIASADSFEKFTVTGSFFQGTPCYTNSDIDVFCPLSGSFIVDQTTGQVVLVDLFRGPTEFNILGNSSLSDIAAFDSIGDFFTLGLPPGITSPGFTSGPLGNTTVVTSIFDGVCAPSVCVNDLQPYLPNSVTDSGPVPNPIPEPEPASGVLVLIGFAPLIALRKRLNLGLFGTDLRSTN